MQRSVERWSDRGTVPDVALAFLLAGLGIAEATVPFSSVTGQGPVGIAVVLVMIGSLPLALRRIFPLPVLIATIFPWALVSLLIDTMVLFWGGLLPMAVAVYTIARHGQGRTAYVGLLLTGLGLLLAALGNEALQSFGELVFPCIVLLVCWLGGLVIARQERNARASERRAAEVTERSEEEARLAIAEERARIARELHDVVAHAVTAMVVQASAAEQVVEDDPAFARRALEGIRETGSRALEEMRRVVHMLREADEHRAPAPHPGLADLPALVAASSTTATHVHLSIEGAPQPLPPGPDLAAYRIVQEAITNAHRHARAREVAVKVEYVESRVNLEVRDDGVGRTPGTPGHGLIGMRERAAAHGGAVEFSSGPGFAVSATLPIPEES